MTPEMTGLPSALPLLLPLNRQQIIKSKVFPFIQCQCFDKRRGVSYWKKSAFFENQGAFLF